MARNFRVLSAEHIAPATVRVLWTHFPLQADSAGSNDARNPASYILAGPGSPRIVRADLVSGNPRAIDLQLADALSAGNWTATSTAMTVYGEVASVGSVSFAAASRFPDNGRENRTGEDDVRSHFNSAYRGGGWPALIAALGYGDQVVRQTAELARAQLRSSTASGEYLRQRAAEVGVRAPSGFGMTDVDLRRFAILKASGSQTEAALWGLAGILYGEDQVRGWMESVAGPFALAAGDTFVFSANDVGEISCTFAAAQFRVITVATAAEVAVVLTEACRAAGSTAYATVTVDEKVRLYSGARGASSAMRQLGGRAQRVLQFPSKISTGLSTLPTWSVTVDATSGRTRFTHPAPTSYDLLLVRPGDLALIYGTEFNAANRGTFEILDVWVGYPSGTLTQWFEVELAGAAQSVGQLATNSLEFHRPIRNGLAVTAPSILFADGGLEINLPSSSPKISRDSTSAAYLIAPADLTVSSVSRAEGGLVTVAATAHGLQVGQQVEVRSSIGAAALPATIAGDIVGPPLKTYASLASIWSTIKDPSDVRADHAAVTLRDGRALVIGGYTGAAYLDTCEMFEITSTTTLAGGQVQYQYEWSAGATLPADRARHRCCLLADADHLGWVLVSGGYDGSALDVCHLLMPVAGGSGSWATTGTLGDARYWHSLSVLLAADDYKVLAAGGYDGTTYLTSCELYDPAAGTWANTGAMATGRSQHAAIVLDDGKVLVAGGLTTSGVPTRLCEVFDPGSATWSATGSMSFSRYDHQLVSTDAGIVAIGGTGRRANSPTAPAALTDAEVWDQATGRWRPFGKTATARARVSVGEASGRILVAGGGSASTELLDGSSGAWRRSLGTALATDGAVLTMLPNGTALLHGGRVSGTPVKTTKLFVPGAEVVYAGGINGVHRVSVVPSANSLQFSTPEQPWLTTTTGAEATPLEAPESDLTGAHIFDPSTGPTIASQRTTTAQALYAGVSYAQIDVTDATELPDAEGWLVLAFGQAEQTPPVKYLGRISATRIKVEHVPFSDDIASGATVILLADRAGSVPDQPQNYGAFHATASNAAVAAARAEALALAADVPVDINVRWPGDRGLAAEGYPAEGPKVTGAVQVFGDDSEALLSAARES